MTTSALFEILLFLVAGYILYSIFAPVKGLRNLKSQQFKEELKQNNNKILIYVREPHEYQEGFIPGAINIPLSKLKSQINTISKDKHVFLYCQSGMRSKQVARILSKNQFQNLTHLQRGFMSWDGKIKR